MVYMSNTEYKQSRDVLPRHLFVCSMHRATSIYRAPTWCRPGPHVCTGSEVNDTDGETKAAQSPCARHCS